MEAPPNHPASSPKNNPRRRDTLKCESCRTRKVKASSRPRDPFCVNNPQSESILYSSFESDQQKCEPSDRNWSNQERCIGCQNLRLPCGPRVLCPPKTMVATPIFSQPSAPTYAEVLSSPAPREPSIAPTLGIRRNEAPSRPSIASQPRGSLLGSVITSSTSSTDNNIYTDPLKNRQRFVASKLRTLGNLRELFQKFDSDRRAIGPESFLPTQSHSESCKCSHCSAFDCTLSRIIHSFTLHLCALRETLDRIDPCHAENSLLRVSHTIETFFKVTRSYVSQDDSKLLGGIDTVYQSVIRRLLTISVEDEDHAEAGRLRQILAEPDPEVAKQLVDTLSDTAMRMSSTLDMLDLPSEVQKVFKIGRATELYPPLHIALNYRIKFSAYELQQVPLESLRAKDPLLRSAVHVAAASSHTEFLRGVSLTPELLKDRDIFNNTPLMVAAYHGNYNSFQILWDTGVGHDLRDTHSRSIMFIACFGGSCEIVEFLLLRGISQRDRSTFGIHHALYVVAARNHSEICRLLLEHNRTQGLFTPSETKEAVKIALENGHTKILELLHGSTTHATNPIQRLPDATQPGQFLEIEQRQTSFPPGYPSNPQTQCPPPPTIASAAVPTPGYSSDTMDTPNFLPADWGGHTEWNGNFLQPCVWDPPTLESNPNFT